MRQSLRFLGCLGGLYLALVGANVSADPLSESLYFEEEQGKVGLAPGLWRLDQRTFFSSRTALFIPTRLDRAVWPRYDNDYWDDDWMGTFRKVLRLDYEPEPWLRLSARGTIAANAFRRGGYYGDWGPRASRLLKTNFQLSAEVFLYDGRVSIYLPWIFQVSRHANYMESARFNRRVRSAVWTCPEVTYYAGNGMSFSLSYETDTLIASDWSETYLWDSVAAGTLTAWVSVPL